MVYSKSCNYFLLSLSTTSQFTKSGASFFIISMATAGIAYQRDDESMASDDITQALLYFQKKASMRTVPLARLARTMPESSHTDQRQGSTPRGPATPRPNGATSQRSPVLHSFHITPSPKQPRATAVDLVDEHVALPKSGSTRVRIDKKKLPPVKTTRVKKEPPPNRQSTGTNNKNAKTASRGVPSSRISTQAPAATCKTMPQFPVPFHANLPNRMEPSASDGTRLADATFVSTDVTRCRAAAVSELAPEVLETRSGTRTQQGSTGTPGRRQGAPSMCVVSPAPRTPKSCVVRDAASLRMSHATSISFYEVRDDDMFFTPPAATTPTTFFTEDGYILRSPEAIVLESEGTSVVQEGAHQAHTDEGDNASTVSIHSFSYSGTPAHNDTHVVAHDVTRSFSVGTTEYTFTDTTADAPSESSRRHLDAPPRPLDATSVPNALALRAVTSQQQTSSQMRTPAQQAPAVRRSTAQVAASRVEVSKQQPVPSVVYRRTTRSIKTLPIKGLPSLTPRTAASSFPGTPHTCGTASLSPPTTSRTVAAPHGAWKRQQEPTARPTPAYLHVTELESAEQERRGEIKGRAAATHAIIAQHAQTSWRDAASASLFWCSQRECAGRQVIERRWQAEQWALAEPLAVTVAVSGLHTAQEQLLRERRLEAADWWYDASVRLLTRMASRAIQAQVEKLSLYLSEAADVFATSLWSSQERERSIILFFAKVNLAVRVRLVSSELLVRRRVYATCLEQAALASMEQCRVEHCAALLSATVQQETSTRRHVSAALLVAHSRFLPLLSSLRSSRTSLVQQQVAESLRLEFVVAHGMREGRVLQRAEVDRDECRQRWSIIAAWHNVWEQLQYSQLFDLEATRRLSCAATCCVSGPWKGTSLLELQEHAHRTYVEQLGAAVTDVATACSRKDHSRLAAVVGMERMERATFTDIEAQARQRCFGVSQRRQCLVSSEKESRLHLEREAARERRSIVASELAAIHSGHGTILLQSERTTALGALIVVSLEPSHRAATSLGWCRFLRGLCELEECARRDDLYALETSHWCSMLEASHYCRDQVFCWVVAQRLIQRTVQRQQQEWDAIAEAFASSRL